MTRQAKPRQRLPGEGESGVHGPTYTDIWASDGRVFNVTLSDVPERRTDLVKGRYELPAPNERTTVAVKIMDMLGEEVLVVQAV